MALYVVGGVIATNRVTSFDTQWFMIVFAVLFTVLTFLESCPHCKRLLWQHKSWGIPIPPFEVLKKRLGCRSHD
jgi:hypothetical protein